MLSEVLVASTRAIDAISSNAGSRDVGIVSFTLHPPAPQSTFKKSSTGQNCLAISDSHVFAAQTGKAVVHVYSRERGNQEAIIPYPEEISCLALPEGGGRPGLLALGTVKGRLILWEIASGRTVTVAQTHLQKVSALAIDSASNYLVSGSDDATIKVVSLCNALSYSHASDSPAEIAVFTQHRSGITALKLGRGRGSAAIAISASKDGVCIIWNYRTTTALRVVLLPSAALCLAIDPCERSFYAGLENGSIQLINLYKRLQAAEPPAVNGNHKGDAAGDAPLHPVYDRSLRDLPLTPDPQDLWTMAGAELGATLSMDICFEGNFLVSGHQSGRIVVWDVAKGRFWTDVTNTNMPVTNVRVLPPTGFEPNSSNGACISVPEIVKPSYESSFGLGKNESKGAAYKLQAKIVAEPGQLQTRFDAFYSLPQLPEEFVYSGMKELSVPAAPVVSSAPAEADEENSLEKENRELRTLVLDMQRVQRETWEVVSQWGIQRAERGPS